MSSKNKLKSKINSKVLLIIILSTLMIFFAWCHFRVNKHYLNKTTLEINPRNGVSLNGFNIFIGYKPDSDDIVTFKLAVEERDSTNQSNESSVIVLVSNNLKFEPNNSLSTCPLNTRRDNDVTRVWTMVKNNYCRPSIQFKGNIFDKINSDISNHFKFSTDLSYEDILSLPVAGIHLYGLNDIKIESIYPEPDKFDNHTIIYKKKEKIADIFKISGINIYGENKFKKHSNQNRIFVLGLLIGAIFSGIIELVISIINDRGKV